MDQRQDLWDKRVPLVRALATGDQQVSLDPRDIVDLLECVKDP